VVQGIDFICVDGGDGQRLSDSLCVPGLGTHKINEINQWRLEVAWGEESTHNTRLWRKGFVMMLLEVLLNQASLHDR
jgi:hypothetical protein